MFCSCLLFLFTYLLKSYTSELLVNVLPSFYADLTKAFTLFDYDKDGVISTNDMKIALKSLGHKFSDHELEDLIKKIDRNGKFHE